MSRSTPYLPRSRDSAWQPYEHATLGGGLVVELYEGDEAWLIEETGKRQGMKLTDDAPVNLLLFLAKSL